MKTCPILQAGVMLTGIQLRTEHPHSYSEHLNRFASESSKCMEKDCEWYNKGCPAHPGKPKKLSFMYEV